jgi:phosphoserine phosphatase RsbU/P
VVPLAAGGFLLGVMPDEVYQEKQVTLDVGDRVVFFTDGLIESRNEIGELYGVPRLQASVAAHGRRPLAEMKSMILADQRTFNGDAPETDDVTLAIAEVLGG